MKLLFIPNWNGHLYLQEYDDRSISKLFEKVDFKDKKLIPVKKNNISETNKLIEESFDCNDFNLSITGDHSNSYPLIKAFSKNNPNFKLVIFDAHPDVEVTSGTISHEDYLRNLIDDGIIKGEDIYLFGIRTFSRVEFEYLQEKKINFYSISEVLKDKNKICEILKSIKEDIYLTIDVDSIDPDEAPGTYYTEWCGLYTNEIIEFINLIKQNVKSCDISEFYAEKDKDKITENNVLKLIDEFIN